MVYVVLGLVVVLLLIAAYTLSRLNDIHACSRTGKTSRVRQLLEKDPKGISARDGNGDLPLHQAAKYGHIDTVKLLLDKGSDINSPTTEGVTPLHYAAAFGEEEMVKLLLRLGAKVDPKENAGMTPIMAAKVGEHAGIIQLLKDAGADDTARPAILNQGGGRFVSSIAIDDPLMAQAVLRARAAVPQLLELFAQYPKLTAVKVPLVTALEMKEKVWAEVLSVEDKMLRVKIQSQPVSGRAAPSGPMQYPLDQIEDWQVELPDGRIRGGYGYQVLFQRTREQLGKLPDELAQMEPRYVDHTPF